MAEKVIVIEKAEVKVATNNNEYLSITDKDGKHYSVFDQAVWNLCTDGAAVKLIGETKGKYFNVETVEVVKDAIEAKQAQEAPSGQERGLWWKETGEMIRAKIITKDTPLGAAIHKAYYAKMIEILGIKVEKGESSE